MDELLRKMNMVQVYRYGEGSLLNNTEISRYYSVLQERIRQDCNGNKHPNPFEIDQVNNSDVISFVSTYDEMLPCVRRWIVDTECIIPDLQNALLEWVDRMSKS